MPVTWGRGGGGGRWGEAIGRAAGRMGASARPRPGTGSRGPDRPPHRGSANLLRLEPGLAIRASGLSARSRGAKIEVLRMSSSRSGQLNDKERVRYSVAGRVFLLS